MRLSQAKAAATTLAGVNAAPPLLFGFQKQYVKLALSVAIDGVGVSSYLLPLAGEGSDAAWAPVSALLVQALYGSSILSGVDFFEELLPFSDFIPTACIGWVLEYTPAGSVVGWMPRNAKKK